MGCTEAEDLGGSVLVLPSLVQAAKGGKARAERKERDDGIPNYKICTF